MRRPSIVQGGPLILFAALLGACEATAVASPSTPMPPEAAPLSTKTPDALTRRPAATATATATFDARAQQKATWVAGQPATLTAIHLTYAVTLTANASALPPCIAWNQVTVEMENQSICVQGEVLGHQDDGQGMRWLFSYEPGTFFMRSSTNWIFADTKRWWPGAHRCLVFTGPIHVADRVPWMDTDDDPGWRAPSSSNLSKSQCRALKPATATLVGSTSFPSPTPIRCLDWSEVTVAMKGKEACVQGIVVDITKGLTYGNYGTRWKFSAEPNTFFMWSFWGRHYTADGRPWPDPGMCLRFTGKIYVDGGVPWMNTEEDPANPNSLGSPYMLIFHYKDWTPKVLHSVLGSVCSK
jgi:hypothetical protein